MFPWQGCSPAAWCLDPCWQEQPWGSTVLVWPQPLRGTMLHGWVSSTGHQAAGHQTPPRLPDQTQHCAAETSPEVVLTGGFLCALQCRGFCVPVGKT